MHFSDPCLLATTGMDHVRITPIEQHGSFCKGVTHLLFGKIRNFSRRWLHTPSSQIFCHISASESDFLSITCAWLVTANSAVHRVATIVGKAILFRISRSSLWQIGWWWCRKVSVMSLCWKGSDDICIVLGTVCECAL